MYMHVYPQAFDSPCLNRKNPKLLVFTRFPVLVNEVDQENNVYILVIKFREFNQSLKVMDEDRINSLNVSN